MRVQPTLAHLLAKVASSLSLSHPPHRKERRGTSGQLKCSVWHVFSCFFSFGNTHTCTKSTCQHTLMSNSHHVKNPSAEFAETNQNCSSAGNLTVDTAAKPVPSLATRLQLLLQLRQRTQFLTKGTCQHTLMSNLLMRHTLIRSSQ